MKYQRNFQQCPYRTSDGKCVHKTPSNYKGKKRRLCGYNRPKKCQYYNDWLELTKIAENSPEGL